MKKENSTPNMGEVWVHNRTGNVHTILRMCRLKIDGDWNIGVAYTDIGNTDLFVRECFKDFMGKFIRKENHKHKDGH